MNDSSANPFAVIWVLRQKICGNVTLRRLERNLINIVEVFGGLTLVRLHQTSCVGNDGSCWYVHDTKTIMPTEWRTRRGGIMSSDDRA